MWKSVITTNNPGLRFWTKSDRVGVFGRILLGALFFSPLFLLSFLSVAPAQAQLFSDDIAREQAVANTDNINKLSTIVNNLRKQLGVISQQQQTLDQRLRELSGQMEEMNARGANKNALRTLETGLVQAAAERQEITDKLGDVGEQLSTLKNNIAEIGEYVTLPEEADMYAAAFGDYQRQNYDKSINGFERVLRYYPEGKFNANARYWMSQIFLAQNQYEKSVQLARQTISLHGDSDKAPDAMLILARALDKLDMPEESIKTLSALIQQYPTTLAADKARQLLTP